MNKVVALLVGTQADSDRCHHHGILPALFGEIDIREYIGASDCHPLQWKIQMSRQLLGKSFLKAAATDDEYGTDRLPAVQLHNPVGYLLRDMLHGRLRDRQHIFSGRTK